jgi:hypothetical protein
MKIYDITLNTTDLRYGKFISRLNNLNNLTRVYLYAISRKEKFESYNDFVDKYLGTKCSSNYSVGNKQDIDSLCDFINFT